MNRPLPPEAGWLLGLIALLWAVPLSATGAIENSVVRVIAVYSDDQAATGSGLIVSPKKILTNWHVIQDAELLYIASEQTTEPVPAHVIWTERDLDLAVLVAEELTQPPLSLSQRDLKKGETVWAIGYPGVSDLGAVGGQGATLNRGVISNFHHKAWSDIFPTRSPSQVVEIIQHDAATNPGNSGGPLVDDCGHVVGVNTAGHPTAHSVFLAIRITESFRMMRAAGVDFKLSDGETCAGPASDPGRLTSQVLFWILPVLLLAALSYLAFRRRERLSGWRKQRTQREALEKEDAASGSGSAPPIQGTGALTLIVSDKPGARRFANILESEGSVEQGGIVFGRHPELVDELIEHPTVSRRHARVFWEDQRCFIEDMNSYRGTKVNDFELEPFKPCALNSGDRIALGDIVMRVERII